MMGGGFFFWNFYCLCFFVYDDVYIFLCYVWYFVEYGDLLWNLGEWVEGYMNFFYLLFVVVGMVIGFELVYVVRFVNLVVLIVFFVVFVVGVLMLIE